MRIKNTAKIVFFCILFLFLLNRIYDVFSWKDTAGDYYSSMETFYDLDKDIVDVLFLGSSHCYCSVIPAKLWEDYGMASFNMSISGQDLAGTYYNFKEALKTQTPKVVCVELYACTYSGYPVEGNLYRNILPRKTSKLYVEAVENMVKTDNKSDYLLRWPIIHTRYKEVKKEDFVKDYPVYLGYRSEFRVTPIWKEEYSFVEPKPFGEEEQQWLLKIIELAQNTNTELVFFLAPYQVPKYAQEYIAYAKEMIAEYDITAMDMTELSEAMAIDWDRDFIDFGHTNYFGACKVTDYFGKFLKATYDLPDHSGDERYALWDLDLKTRQHEVTNYYLTQIGDAKTYLEELSRLEDYTIIVSTTGEYISGEANIDEYLQLLGSFQEFYDGAGVWVFDNQNCSYVAAGNDFLQALPLSYGEVLLSGAGGRTSVTVDRTEYQKTENGINIVIYDNLQGVVADSIGLEAMYSYGIVR